MPKGSETLTNARRNEIIEACAKLYQTMSFKDITIKEIGGATSFTRTSIYNYFQTKEEIFLALLEQEYELWVAELQSIMDENESLDRESFADKIAGSLDHRRQLLKIMSMNMYDIEENSRMERLVDLKRHTEDRCRFLPSCLQNSFLQWELRNGKILFIVFFPFVYGIHPYTVVTDKQREAMKEAGVNYTYHSIYEITWNCLTRLLPEAEL